MRVNCRGGLVGLSVLALMSTALPARHAEAQAEINNLLILPRAAAIDDFDSVLGLLQNGASVDTEGEDSRAALSFAAANGDVRIIDLLLDHLANVDHRDRFGDTALHWAAVNGRVDACKRLIAAKAQIDAQNGQGVTPLMMAISSNRREVTRLLLAAGADVKLQDYTGHDAVSWARDKPSLLAIVQAGASH